MPSRLQPLLSFWDLWENDKPGGLTSCSDLNSAYCTHTFPSRMVSHVALFLLTGHSSISCMDTSYSPSNSCRRLQTNTQQHLLTLEPLIRQRLKRFFFLPVRRHCVWWVRAHFTCFYRRLSSQPQTWFLPPPWERSSSSSCWLLPLKNLRHMKKDTSSSPCNKPCTTLLKTLRRYNPGLVLGNLPLHFISGIIEQVDFWTESKHRIFS